MTSLARCSIFWLDFCAIWIQKRNLFWELVYESSVFIKTHFIIFYNIVLLVLIKCFNNCATPLSLGYSRGMKQHLHQKFKYRQKVYRLIVVVCMATGHPFWPLPQNFLLKKISYIFPEKIHSKKLYYILGNGTFFLQA